jgi:hypothetical protein
MSRSAPVFHLYIDDTGTRDINLESDLPRADGMDHFALGGFLVADGAVCEILAAHKQLSEKWGLTYPLHSTRIRGRRKAFSWLRTDLKKEAEFLSDLTSFIVGAPIVCISCVIDRPGYKARYSKIYSEPWLLCQTAFAILVERACKYVARSNGNLSIYFEQSGEREDRAQVDYMKSLKTVGMPFPGSKAAGYRNLPAEDFKRIVIGEPRRRPCG